MPIATWVALANDGGPGTPAFTAPVTSNTFTGPQDITTGTTGTLGVPLVAPANFLHFGMQWRFTASGTYSVTGTPTLLWGIYVGTAAQATTTAFAASTGVTTMNWQMHAMGTVRTVGATTVGTMVVTGYVMYSVTSNTAAPTVAPLWQAPIAVGTGFDTTALNKLSIQATYSASSASNIVVLHQWLVEYLN